MPKMTLGQSNKYITMTREELSKQTLDEREKLINKYYGALPDDSAISLVQVSKMMIQMEEEY